MVLRRLRVLSRLRIQPLRHGPRLRETKYPQTVLGLLAFLPWSEKKRGARDLLVIALCAGLLLDKREGLAALVYPGVAQMV
jgi:hypothetical protein